METYLREPRSVETQRLLPFTGEGAYHGATKRRGEPAASSASRAAEGPPPVEEMRPRTLEAYAASGRRTIASFEATFPNLYDLKAELGEPDQDEIRDDGVTFCWCPFELALREAGPLVKRVLEAMRPHLHGDKRYTYVDAKIQYFAKGDLAVDSQLWHVDGSIAARDERVRALGHPILHDLRARHEAPERTPHYLSYQSSTHCATLFATEPVTVTLPELIPSFDVLHDAVAARDPRAGHQPAGSIVAFDGFSLHRPVPAEDDGWRLWVRGIETDREVRLSNSIIECYGTVFRP